MVKVLVVGGGAREHALVEALPPDAEVCSVSPNRNPGILRRSRHHLAARETEVEKVVEFARARRVDIGVVGPEAPLAAGLADALEAQKIPVLGPRRAPARIEWDKAFARELMYTYRIPGLPDHHRVSTEEELKRGLNDLGERVVVKPIGLTGGKGVRVMGDHLASRREAEAYAREVLKRDGQVLLEEKLEGEEFTLMALSDGKNLVPMPAVQDHKRAHEGDRGPNTGGMGSYSDSNHLLPFLRREDYEAVLRILKRVTVALKAETGEPYRGVLYAGAMVTHEGPHIIEFNSRLGDPEACNVLPLLQEPLPLERFLDQTLDHLPFQSLATVCKYAVPEGYPDRPRSGQSIQVGDPGPAHLYYASVTQSDGSLLTSGSRAIASVGTAPSLEEAERKAEQGLRALQGPLCSRHDIGTRALIQRRVEHMKALGRPP